MPTKIQIARGNKSKVNSLPQGSLFWQAANENNQFSDRPWDEGTLYIYGPHLQETDSPLAIGGSRYPNAFIFKGYLTTEADIQDEKFKYARFGDTYLWQTDSSIGDFHTVDDFRKGDLLFITSVTIDEETGVSSDIQYTRINCSGGFADDTYFDGLNSSLEARDVSSAIKELELEKLSYKGTLATQQSIAELKLEIGSCYICIGDNLVFSSPTGSFTAKRGDFVYYRNDTLLWKLIPSGLSDDTDIDFTSANEIASEMYDTFETVHTEAVSNIANVGEALSFLMKEKAQLDSNGKVPLSQMSDTLLGTSRYKGVWSPILENTDEANIGNPDYQNPLPGYTPLDIIYPNVSTEVPKAGDYWIVKIADFESKHYDKVVYYDKNSLQADGTYSKTFTVSNGDWIIYQYDIVSGETSSDGSWEVIDRTEDLSYLDFYINGVYNGDSVDYSTDTTVYSLLGTPQFKSDGKIVFINDGGTLTIGGVRLVNMAKASVGLANYVPKFSNLEENSLTNTHIEDVDDKVIFHSETNVGTPTETQSFSTFGDINIQPHSQVINETSSYSYSKSNLNFIDSFIESIPSEETQTYTETTSFLKSTITISESDGISISEASDASDLGNFGELKEAVNSNNSLALALDSFDILDTSTVSFSEQELLVGDIVILQYIASEDEGSLGTLVSGEQTLTNAIGTFEVLSTQETELTRVVTISTDTIVSQKISLTTQDNSENNSVILLPSKSGILARLEDVSGSVKGTEDYIPIYGKDEVIDGITKSTLINSNAKKSVGLLNTLLSTEDNSFLNLSTADTDLMVGYNVAIVDSTEGEISPKSLYVSDFLALGNASNQKVFMLTGNRLYPHAVQHFDVDGNALEFNDIYVETPTVGGVILTGNSIIDGGSYTETTEDIVLASGTNTILNPRGSLTQYLESNSLSYGELFVATESNGTLGIYAGDKDKNVVKVGVTSVASYQGEITEPPEVWIHGGIYIYSGLEAIEIMGKVFTPSDTFMYATTDGLNSTETTDTEPALVPLGKGILDAANITIDNSVHTRLGATAQESFEIIDSNKFEYGGTVSELATKGVTLSDRGCFYIQPNAETVTLTIGEENLSVKHGSMIFLYGRNEELSYVLYTGPDTATDIDFVFSSERQTTLEDLGLESLPESEVSNVKDALDLLLNAKADLDKDGKIPSSQLPRTDDPTFTGENDAFPVFQDKNLVESSVYQIPTSSEGEKTIGFIFRGSSEVIAKAPTLSGTLLTNNSVIDCGEYDENGNVTYPLEDSSLSLSEVVEAHIEV